MMKTVRWASHPWKASRCLAGGVAKKPGLEAATWNRVANRWTVFSRDGREGWRSASSRGEEWPKTCAGEHPHKTPVHHTQTPNPKTWLHHNRSLPTDRWINTLLTHPLPDACTSSYSFFTVASKLSASCRASSSCPPSSADEAVTSRWSGSSFSADTTSRLASQDGGCLSGDSKLADSRESQLLHSAHTQGRCSSLFKLRRGSSRACTMQGDE